MKNCPYLRMEKESKYDRVTLHISLSEDWNELGSYTSWDFEVPFSRQFIAECYKISASMPHPTISFHSDFFILNLFQPMNIVCICLGTAIWKLFEFKYLSSSREGTSIPSIPFRQIFFTAGLGPMLEDEKQFHLTEIWEERISQNRLKFLKKWI